MRSIVLAALSLVVSCATVCAQTVAPQIGGAGGGPFTDTCKPGDVLIGYNVVSGKAMNRFAAVCQAQNNGVPIGSNYGLRTWGQDDRSGIAFHAFSTPRCPAGTAVTEMGVWVNKFNELDSVSATCSALLPNTARTSALDREAPGGGEAVRNGSSACRTGEVAVGVTGRSGALVDALGLVCAPFPWHQAAAVKPVPPTPTPATPTGPTAPKFVKVLKDVDIYDRPAPPPGDARKGTLARGTANVTLAQKGSAGWYRLNWPGGPAGNDWVYSAADFPSLDPASLAP